MRRILLLATAFVISLLFTVQIPAAPLDGKTEEIRLQNLASESPFTNWYLKMSDKQDDLELSEKAVKGATWTYTRNKEGLYQLENTLKGRYLDVGLEIGVADLGKSRSGTGTWWKFVQVEKGRPDKGYHLQCTAKNSRNENLYLDIDKDGKLVMSKSAKGTGTRWKVTNP